MNNNPEIKKPMYVSPMIEVFALGKLDIVATSVEGKLLGNEEGVGDEVSW